MFGSNCNLHTTNGWIEVLLWYYLMGKNLMVYVLSFAQVQHIISNYKCKTLTQASFLQEPGTVWCLMHQMFCSGPEEVQRCLFLEERGSRQIYINAIIMCCNRVVQFVVLNPGNELAFLHYGFPHLEVYSLFWIGFWWDAWNKVWG